MKNKKVIIITIFMSISLLLCIVGFTVAYFSNTEVFNNLFSTAIYQTTVTEVFESPESWLPGDTTPKTLTITNTGNVDVRARVCITEKWESANGNTLSNEVNGEKVAILNLDNTDEWTRKGTCHEYNEVLEPNDETSSFMSSVTFNPNIEIDSNCVTTTNNGTTTKTCSSTGNGYDNADYKLTLKAQTIQEDVAEEEWLNEFDIANVLRIASRDGKSYARKGVFSFTDSPVESMNTKIIYSPNGGQSIVEETRDKINVLFGGFCWQIIRTTSTGGTKLIYNGIPDNGVCNKTGNDATIGNSKFNAEGNILSHVGYMYNASDTEPYYVQNLSYNSTIIDSVSINNNYYYSKNVINSNGTYRLDNPDMIDINNISNIYGSYTLLSNNSNYSSSDIYYVFGSDDNNIYYYKMTNISEVYNNIKYSDTYNYDNNQIHLTNYQEVSLLDYMDNPSILVGKYICGFLHDNDCINAYYVNDATSTTINITPIEVVYGSSVNYNEVTNKYSLVDTERYTTIDKENHYKHYTCFNSNSECETVYYAMYYSTNDKIAFVKLYNGDTIEDYLEKYLGYNNENINIKDSIIKAYIDDWYENNLLNYADKIENVVYENNRTLNTSKNYNWFVSNSNLNVSYTDFSRSLKIIKENDKFYVGNPLANLKYPVGLITYSETVLIGYIKLVGVDYWTMSPDHITNQAKNFGFISFVKASNINPYGSTANNSKGVRPVISLKPGTEFVSGDGSKNNPYIVP